MRNNRVIRDVEFEITHRSFVDGQTSRGYAPGIWTLSNEEANRFEALGYGHRVGGKAKSKAAKASEGLAGGAPPRDEVVEQPLPDKFPERAALVEAGIDTIEKLQASTPENLSEIFKGSKAKINKVGLALGDFGG